MRAGLNVPAGCAEATAGGRGRRQTSAGALDRLPRYAGTAAADADGEGRPSTSRPRRTRVGNANSARVQVGGRRPRRERHRAPRRRHFRLTDAGGAWLRALAPSVPGRQGLARPPFESHRMVRHARDLSERGPAVACARVVDEVPRHVIPIQDRALQIGLGEVRCLDEDEVADHDSAERGQGSPADEPITREPVHPRRSPDVPRNPHPAEDGRQRPAPV